MAALRNWLIWLNRNGAGIQAIAGILALLVATGAAIGIKVQIDASARLQREQSARDIYREFLNLSIGKPEFADPDYCAIKGSAQEVAYQNYVDYLLYTSEQMLSVSPEWEGALREHLSAHAAYLCGIKDWSQYPETVRDMVARARSRICGRGPPACPR